MYFFRWFRIQKRWTFETGLTTVIYFRRMTSFCKSIGLLEGDFVFSFLQLSLPFTHFFLSRQNKSGIKEACNSVFFFLA